MAYVEFPRTPQGNRDRFEFWTGPEGLELIRQWRREGLSMEEIALRHVGVVDNTFKRWRMRSEELERAIRQTDELVNARVERSLLERATGYEEVVVEEELVEGELRVTRRTTRRIPPDTKAALSWLFSRRPDRWRAQQAPLDSSREELEAVRDVAVSITEAARAGAPVEAPVEVEARVEELPDGTGGPPSSEGV